MKTDRTKQDRTIAWSMIAFSIYMLIGWYFGAVNFWVAVAPGLTVIVPFLIFFIWNLVKPKR